jgi:2'-5' RNA ligase
MEGGLRSFEIAYVILLSDEAHNYMSKLQIDILRRYGVNPGLKATPHITLKLGFQASEIEPFERYFDELVSGIEPFEICVKDMGFFDEGIIFIDVEHNPQLERLRRRILGDLSEQHGIQPYPLEGDRYHFHATLAYGLSKHDFARARRELQDLKVEFRFLLDTLALFCHTGEEWIAYKRGRVIGSKP